MSLLLKSFLFLSFRARPLAAFPSIVLPKSLSGNRRTRTLSSVSASTFQSPPSPSISSEAPNPIPPLTDSLRWVSRTAFCGHLSDEDVGSRVRLCGWVALTVHMITSLPGEFPDAHDAIKDLRLEYVVAVEGVVRSRPSEAVNKKMKTGSIEVTAEDVQILNAVRLKLPLLVTSADDANDFVKEEIRLRYRYLDLRRQQMNFNMMLRHKVIETPMLSRSTRRCSGLFGALKDPDRNILCFASKSAAFQANANGFWFDKYYQIARCFRDEDLRADRQPEFTQLDMEMAFTPLEDMLTLNEDLIRKVFLEIKGIELPNPFPRLTYADAMDRYGSDRPDIRFDLEFSLQALCRYIKKWGIVKTLCVPSGAKRFSNTALKKGDVYNEAIKSGAKGLPFLKVLDDGEIEGIPALVSSLGPTNREEFLRRCSAQPGDLILFAVGHHTSVNRTLDRLRVFMAHELGLVDHSRHSILWVTDFPMFEWNDSEQRLEPCIIHLLQPNPEDMGDLSSARA
ncbi:hypothetical protein GQ457_18G019910 [Hibiscus cannabinus]